MTASVSLRHVVEAMELPDEWAAYVNRQTGEIVTVSDEDQRLAEDDVDLDDLPDWQRESLPKVREPLESNDYLALPGRFEVHEWDVMRRFAESRDDVGQRNELVDALHGPGAFRMFRSSLRRLGIEEQWYSSRQSALEQIAKDWLEAHGIAYKE